MDVVHTPPSVERFISLRGHERADVYPVWHTSASTPAARALEQRPPARLSPGEVEAETGTVAEEGNQTRCL